MKVAIPTTFPRCRVCKKPLRNPKSCAKGIGPECAEKFAWMLCDASLTLEALEIPESISTVPAVARQLHLAECALLAGNRGDMQRFKAGAKRAVAELALAKAA